VTALVVILVVIVVIALLVVLWGVFTYNGLVRLRNQVQEAWRQIDVELTRRHDLIPNLVETVKGYASHERETLDAVVRARAAATAPGATVAQQAQQEGELSQALGRLMAISEAYPDLKANQNFMALQAELGSTEDRIASGRRFYNANVRELNTKIESVPSNIIAGMGNFKQADYFEAQGQVRSAPQVSFGSSAPGVSFGPPGSQPRSVGSSQPGSLPGSQPGSLEPGAPAPEPGAPDYGSPPR
jgi:LemA protein